MNYKASPLVFGKVLLLRTLRLAIFFQFYKIELLKINFYEIYLTDLVIAKASPVRECPEGHRNIATDRQYLREKVLSRYSWVRLLGRVEQRCVYFSEPKPEGYQPMGTPSGLLCKLHARCPRGQFNEGSPILLC